MKSFFVDCIDSIAYTNCERAGAFFMIASFSHLVEGRTQSNLVKQIKEEWSKADNKVKDFVRLAMRRLFKSHDLVEYYMS